MASSTQPNRPRFESARADASAQIALQIRHYLQEQGLQPGDRIGTEHELAAEFGVSRPTLREAVRLLSSTHLIRVDRGRAGGIFVARTPNEGMSRNVTESIAAMLATKTVSMQQLLDARMFLEVPLAGLAARNSDDEVVAKLEQAIEDARGHKPGSEQFNSADARFHETLAEAAGNDLLIAFTDWILEVLMPSLVGQIAGAVDAEEILRQHSDILRAVRRKQAAAAERAMRAHLEHMLAVVHQIDAKS